MGVIDERLGYYLSLLAVGVSLLVVAARLQRETEGFTALRKDNVIKCSTPA